MTRICKNLFNKMYLSTINKLAGAESTAGAQLLAGTLESHLKITVLYR